MRELQEKRLLIVLDELIGAQEDIVEKKSLVKLTGIDIVDGKRSDVRPIDKPDNLSYILGQVHVELENVELEVVADVVDVLAREVDIGVGVLEVDSLGGPGRVDDEHGPPEPFGLFYIPVEVLVLGVAGEGGGFDLAVEVLADAGSHGDPEEVVDSIVARQVGGVESEKECRLDIHKVDVFLGEPEEMFGQEVVLDAGESFVFRLFVVDVEELFAEGNYHKEVCHGSLVYVAIHRLVDLGRGEVVVDLVDVDSELLEV